MLKKKDKFEYYGNMIDKKRHPIKWLGQVFIYHNWPLLLTGAIIISVLTYLIYQSVTTEKYDVRFILAYYDTVVVTDYGVKVEDELEDTFSDVNGDGKVTAGLDLLNLGDGLSVDVNEAYWRKFLTSLSDSNYVMYILDNKLMNMYSKTSNGDSPFDSTCIKLYTGKDQLSLKLDDSTVFKDSEYTGDNGLYIAFRPKPASLSSVSDEVYYGDYLKLLELLLPEEKAG